MRGMIELYLTLSSTTESTRNKANVYIDSRD
jgi:hypothetical protein